MMKSIFDKLMSFSDVHELNRGLTDEEIRDFETTNKIALPQALKEIYKQFNGGELFIPGTTIFGIGDAGDVDTIRRKNAGNIRGKMSLSKNYLIFAELNYGDFVCINLNNPYDIIQWSHEDDELFCEWGSMEEWFTEMIADYEEYEAGD